MKEVCLKISSEKELILYIDSLLEKINNFQFELPLAYRCYSHGEWGICVSEIVSFLNEKNGYNEENRKLIIDIIEYFGDDYIFEKPEFLLGR
jgi:hypothetical protein